MSESKKINGRSSQRPRDTKRYSTSAYTKQSLRSERTYGWLHMADVEKLLIEDNLDARKAAAKAV